MRRRIATLITLSLSFIASPGNAEKVVKHDDGVIKVAIRSKGTTSGTTTGRSGSASGNGSYVVSTQTVTTRVSYVTVRGWARKRVSTFVPSTPSPRPRPPVKYSCGAHVADGSSVATVTGYLWRLCSDGRRVRVPQLCYAGWTCVRAGRQASPRSSVTGQATVRVRKVITAQTNTVTSLVSVPTTPSPPPDVDAMVAEALRKLPPPEPITSPPLDRPGASGVVGVPFFYAVPPEQWEVVAPSVTSNGGTLTIRATPTRLILHPADSDESDPPCFTAGNRVFKMEWARRHPQQVCSHTYEASSPDQMSYKGSLSIGWHLEVETEGIDEDQIVGKVPDYTETSTDLTIPITEIQAVLR